MIDNKYFSFSHLETYDKRNSLKIYPHNFELNKFQNYYNKKNNFQKKKITKNIRYIEKISNDLFRVLYKELNSYHNINKSKKYWEIILLPWIYHFIENTFNKFLVINEKIKNDKKLITNIDTKYYLEDILTPRSYEYITPTYQSDEWHYLISSFIIKFCFKKKLKIIDKKNYKIRKKITLLNKNLHKRFYNKFNFFNFFNLFNGNIFFPHFINKIVKLKFLIFKFEFPVIFNFKEKFFLQKKISLFREKNITFKKLSENPFEKFILNNIQKFIPHMFLEDFNYYEKECLKFMPKKPKFIFNHNSLWWNTLLMFYTANKVSSVNTKIINYQHGAGYGIYKTFYEKHEINISKYFLTWGWKSHKKTIPYKINRIFYKKKSSKNITFVLNSDRRYYILDPNSMDELGWRNYLEKILSISKIIQTNKIEYVKIKTHPTNYWNEFNFLKKKFHGKKIFFEKNRDINDVLSSSKLVIFTYLATPFFQSLSSLNIPTIIYFDYKKFDISKENIMLFEKLKQLNLLFDDFNKLLRFLANNSDNIEQWWQ